MAYKTTVTGIGPLVAELMEQGMLIVFDDNAPPELAELSVLHTKGSLENGVKTGDTVILGNKSYTATAVGYEAVKTLDTMGHCTFVFTGSSEAELPGYIVLSGDGMPEIKPGDSFEIIGRA